MDAPKNRRRQLNRDQRLQIQTLRSVGLSYDAIARQLSVTNHQVQYACSKSDPTPAKRPGRPPTLSTEQQNELVQYVCQSDSTRRLSYRQLSVKFEHWNATEDAIRLVLRKRGICRGGARRKPPVAGESRVVGEQRSV